MNKRSVPIAIVSCILAVAGLVGYFLPAPVEALPPRLLMENQGGRVIFTHKAHATSGGAYGDIQCAVCHHELNIAPEAVQDDAQKETLPCKACHGTADAPGFAVSHQEKYLAEGGEKSCISCHHTRMAGFSSTWNHEEHQEYAGGDCQTCHHPENYPLDSGKTMRIKPQKCSNCHTAQPNPLARTTLKDAVHPKCNECHDDWFDQKAKGCLKCHSQVSSAADLANGTLDKNFPACSTCHAPIPDSMTAYHGNCIGCHDTAKKGPGKEAPCAQCHTP